MTYAAAQQQLLSELLADLEVEAEERSGEREVRRKKSKSAIMVRGFPEARPGAGLKLEYADAACAAGAEAPAGAAAALDAAPRPPPSPLALPAPRPPGYVPGKVRQPDGLQARLGHARIAGALLLHPHEEAGLHKLMTQPPYYAPPKLADLLVRAAAAQRAGISSAPRSLQQDAQRGRRAAQRLTRPRAPAHVSGRRTACAPRPSCRATRRRPPRRRRRTCAASGWRRR